MWYIIIEVSCIHTYTHVCIFRSLPRCFIFPAKNTSQMSPKLPARQQPQPRSSSTRTSHRRPQFTRKPQAVYGGLYYQVIWGLQEATVDPYEPSKNLMESQSGFFEPCSLYAFWNIFSLPDFFPKANKKSTFFGPFRDKNSLIQLDACDAGLHDTRCQNFELPAVIKRWPHLFHTRPMGQSIPAHVLSGFLSKLANQNHLPIYHP